MSKVHDRERSKADTTVDSLPRKRENGAKGALPNRPGIGSQGTRIGRVVQIRRAKRIAPLLLLNPETRLCQPERLATAGLENSPVEPVRDDPDETGKNPVRVRDGPPAGLRNRGEALVSHVVWLYQIGE